MYKYDILFTYIYITIIIINYAIAMQTFQTRDRLHKQKQNTVCIRVFQMENFVNVPLGNRLRNHTHTHKQMAHQGYPTTTSTYWLPSFLSFISNKKKPTQTHILSISFYWQTSQRERTRQAIIFCFVCIVSQPSEQQTRSHRDERDSAARSRMDYSLMRMRINSGSHGISRTRSGIAVLGLLRESRTTYMAQLYVHNLHGGKFSRY